MQTSAQADQLSSYAAIRDAVARLAVGAAVDDAEHLLSGHGGGSYWDTTLGT